jgi:hypothetical protein
MAATPAYIVSSVTVFAAMVGLALALTAVSEVEARRAGILAAPKFGLLVIGGGSSYLAFALGWVGWWIVRTGAGSRRPVPSEAMAR